MCSFLKVSQCLNFSRIFGIINKKTLKIAKTNNNNNDNNNNSKGSIVPISKKE